MKKFLVLLLVIYSPVLFFAQWSSPSITAFRQFAISCNSGLDCYLIAADNATDSSVTVYRTKNGGGFWKRSDTGIPVNKAGAFGAFLRIDSDTCYFAKQKLYKTTNGGQSWTQQPIVGMNDRVNTISFPTPRIGYVYENYYRKIYRSADYGKTWQPVSTSLPITFARIIKKISFTSENEGHLLMIDTVERKQYLMKTVNGGGNWQTSYRDTLQFELMDLQFANTMLGYACGKYGTLLKTTDGGSSWSVVQHPYIGSSETDYQALDLLGSNSIYVVASNSKIIKSTDGGAHWDDETYSFGWMRDVSIASEDTVYVAMSYSVLLVNMQADLLAGINGLDPGQVRIYPNPAEHELIIETRDLSSGATLLLTDLLGKEVRTQTFTGNKTILTRDGLPAGFYLLSLNVNGQRIALGKVQMI